jgi:O-methyltransferase involved in polyketide biosynthesis
MTLNLSGVHKTLLLPLWSRAKLTLEGNSILLDPKAVEIVKGMQYDFDLIDRYLPFTSHAMNLGRARMFDYAIIRFLTDYPRASVANLGAGLDTTFSRVDNGSLTWYDIDLPDVIQLRKQLIPDTERSRCVSSPLGENRGSNCR